MPASVASSDGRGPASSTSSLTGASANPATSGLAAALKGATLAFQHQQKTAAKGSEHTAVPRTLGSSRVPTPGTTPVSAATSRTVGGSNGAFLAANIAAREHSPPTATSTSKNKASRVATSASSSTSGGSAGRMNRQEQAHGQVTGRSSQQAQHVEVRAGNDHAPSKRPKMHSRRPSLAFVSTQAASNTNSHPPTPTATSKSGPEPKAASWIAATLAASRSGTPSPSPSLGSMNQQTHPALAQQHVRSGRTRSSSVATSTFDTPSPPALESHHLDTASIPPTSSLVAIYDGKQEEAEPVKKVKKKKSPPASRAEYHQTVTSPSPTPSESPNMEKRPGSGGELAVAPGKTKLAPKPKPKQRRDISLSTVESIGNTTGTMGREGESNSQGQGETRNRDGDVRGQASREGEDQATETGAKDIASVGTSGRKGEQKSSPASPRSVQSKQGVGEVPADDKRSSTPPVPQHAQISETKIVSPQPRRVVSTPRLESSPVLPKLPPKPVVTSPRPDNNKPTIRKSSRVVSSSMDRQSQTTRQSAAETVSLGDRRLSRNSTSSDETFVSASSSPSPRPQSPVAAKVELERERARPRLDRTNTGTTSSRASRVSTPASVRSPVSQTRPSPILRPGTGLHSYSTGASPTPEMSLDSLTNAMIASNLASSRLAALTQSASLDSPGLPLIPSPRRNHRHHHHPHLRHHTQSPPHASPLIPQRTADSLPPRRQMEQSQPTSLLKTLRAPRSLSDDEDLRLQTARHRKKHLGMVPSSKKHAHNEGARRRWRDEMTLRQRRRYEAVWASNRGLFLKPDFAFEHPGNWQPPTPPDDSPPVRQVDLARALEGPEADLVVNIVVRDIWSRSRLPVDELAEVWELVDRRKCGALDKQEFVVGMWLIDQRLRGRKIPTVVGEGVWESARDRVMSVNVKAPKGKHHHHGHHHGHGLHGHGHKSGGRTRGHLKGAF